MYSILKKVKNMSAIFKNLCYNYIRINERGKFMSKVVVKTSLVGNDSNHQVTSTGILTNQKMIYRESDLQVTIEWTNERVILKRNTKEYELEFCFELEKSTTGYHKMKTLPLCIDMKITTKELNIKDHSLTIVYELIYGGENLGEFTYHLDYEVIK